MNDTHQTLRVVTWNIHRCIGTDGRYDIARSMRVIRAIAPDIAAFQEVDSRSSQNPGIDTYTCLRDQVGGHSHEAWALSGADGHYGQMLASRFPLEGRHVHDISVAGREPRKVMEATACLPFGTLRVVATHLGLRQAERSRQLIWLREILMTDLKSPLLLLGDLNEWHDRRLRYRLSDLFDIQVAHRSYPSHFPLFALDRMMCRAGPAVVHSNAIKETRNASDHLPVFGRISIPPLV